jgi:hypothetical protein
MRTCETKCNQNNFAATLLTQHQGISAKFFSEIGSAPCFFDYYFKGRILGLHKALDFSID